MNAATETNTEPTAAQARRIRSESPIPWPQIKEIAKNTVWQRGGPQGWECFSMGVQNAFIDSAAFNELWQAASIGGGTVTPEQMIAVRDAIRLAIGMPF